MLATVISAGMVTINPVIRRSVVQESGVQNLLQEEDQKNKITIANYNRGEAEDL
jgi:hypothetical protein